MSPTRMRSQGRDVSQGDTASRQRAAWDRQLDRRTFLAGAVELGISASLAGSLLAGCGSSAATGGTASLFDSFADEYFTDEVRGASEAAKALGLPIHSYTFGENASLQVSQVQDAVTRGIKTMGVYAPLGAGLTQMIAAAKGNAVLAFEYDIPPWTYPSTYGPTYGFYVVPLEPAVVDQSNVEKYLKLLKSASLPYDWKRMSRILNPDGWENQGAWYPIEPEAFWAERNLGTTQPASWLALDAKTALANGAFKQLTQEYTEHIGTQPI